VANLAIVWLFADLLVEQLASSTTTCCSDAEIVSLVGHNSQRNSDALKDSKVFPRTTSQKFPTESPCDTRK
jgi:hypothetical protein